MKKFLSILLALAVGFTFTFGSAMSAFATDGDATNAKSLLDEAYKTAVATEFKVDYDDLTGEDDNAANAITVFTIDKTAVQAGIYAAYMDVKGKITNSNANNVLGIDTTSSNTDTDAVKIAKLRVALETAAVAGGAYVNASYEAAFDAYKAYLTSVVNAISTENYTTTNYNDLGMTEKFESVSGNEYETSKEAAEADKAWAVAAIAKAKFDGTTKESLSTTDAWKTNITDLYKKVFEGAFKIILNKDDVYDENKVTSVSYKMKNDYSTATDEKNSSAILEVGKAQAKAALVSQITTFEVSSAYKAKYAGSVAAYKEAMEYRIENATNSTISAELGVVEDEISSATETNIVLKKAGSRNWVERAEYAAKAKADAATNKQIAEIKGEYYDSTKADEALVKVLLKIYYGSSYDSENQTAGGEKLYGAKANLTAGEKAEYKAAKDYSDVEADEDGLYEFKTYNTGSLAEAEYYAKEWEAVKAAADAYCTAVDTAVTVLDVEKAEAAYKEATLAKNIKDYSAVDGIFTSLDYTLVKAYFDKVSTANSGIYVTWDDGENYVTGLATEEEKKAYKTWVIGKGARTLAEADAFYADACAVINAFKTKSQLTAEAAAVQTKIAALPTTITLADKATVIDAYTAYKALASDYRAYVANSSTLKTAVDKLKSLEGAEVIKLVNALPALSKVTVTDKAAVKTACEAYEAWANEAAYSDEAVKTTTISVTDPTDTGLKYPEAVKKAEYNALLAAYTPLKAKWDVDALTADDAAAVKSLQDAVATYIDEYSAAFEGEATLTKMAASIAKDTAWTTEDVKAYVFDQAVKASSVKLSAKKVKVTANFDASKLTENGYTVEYKFYKSTKKSSGYTYTGITKSGDNATYTNTNAKKGANYYKFKVVVKDADGTVILTTALKDCKYACRTIK